MQKRNNRIILSICIVMLTCVSSSNASDNSGVRHFFTTNIDYGVDAHFSLGGSLPVDFPREIRKIESYNPGLQTGIGVHATKWFSDTKDWGIRLQVGVERKGMKTEARVKNYLTEIIQDQSSVRGYYTGLVKTEVGNTFVVIPVSLVYGLSDRVNLYGGFRASFVIDKGFKGYVSDGYLREETPVGTKISFEDGSRAAYDFSSELNTVQWGTQLGAEWSMRNNFKIFSHIDYTFTSLLDKDFTAISFNMHNIYLNIGFGYNF